MKDGYNIFMEVLNMNIFDFTGERIIFAGDKKLFLYSVDKQEELFKMNFKGIDTFFNTLDSVGNKAIGNAMILFDGYNDVATELYEVPQVRKFVKELFNRYPYLLNYINFDIEGHHSLLACLLDIEVMYKGERLTFDEHAKRYGFGKPMPKHNVHMKMPSELLAHLVKSMFSHGNTTGTTKYADKQAYKLMEIFKRA
jgi:hypothetical protein